MKIFVQPFTLLLFISLSLNLVGQNQQLTTTSKKAEKYFFSAIDQYQAKNFENALSNLKKALDQDPFFTEAFILQGDILIDDHQIEKAILSYQQAINTNRPFSPNLYMILATQQLNMGKYADARFNFSRYLEFERIPEQNKQRAELCIKKCDFALHCIANPVPFTLENLGDSINSPNDEYINDITSDDEKLYFTRKNPRDENTTDPTLKFEEDFYYSQRIDSLWTKAVNLGSPINSHGNEGALNISPDGQYLFFAACNRPDGYGSCDLYWAKRIGSRWSVPENLGSTVNSPQWDSQPSFSSDGKTLYFSSNRPGGRGSSDLWKTTLLPDNQWSEPINLGDSINTRAEEMAPFIHPDDQTLYFSSKGHLGMGGLDLFYSRKNFLGNWQKPVNIGYPINTHADEISIIVNADGKIAYISSDIPGGKGKQDIYKFNLYKEAQPVPANYFKGIVFDSETKERLGARFELIDLQTSRTIVESNSDKNTGEFLLIIPARKNYALNVSKDGYLFFSENFTMLDGHSQGDPFINNIYLKPMKVGEAVILKNIFFDTDQFTLKETSLIELHKLLELLKNNPKLKIEISGHTDIIGTMGHNLELSKNRAKTVYDYLILNGIVKDRLSFEGYGSNNPVDSNETEAGRANNRRTEFKIISN
ncbi:MAG: OmpA family protein [Bacteroidales bacterium]|nr:OmpA family protein [Bacteroidales bacterium]